MYKRSPGKKNTNSMTKKDPVVSLHEFEQERKRLWKDAIKWPLYSIAVMPVVLAGAWRIGSNQKVDLKQFLGFLLASVLLLIWENLTNDLFDSETGVDEISKPHSVVALIGKKDPIQNLANACLIVGLLIVYLLALNSSYKVFYLVMGSCCLGYLYQGPPFRLGYQGLGEPLCWIAFGPLATAAGILVLSNNNLSIINIPWKEALIVGSGPALATTLVLFCSHFHQVAEDAANGKNSPLVRLGTRRASAMIPWFILIIFALECFPIIHGDLPISGCLGLIALPSAISLIRLIKTHHNKPSLINKSKFLALRFQALNGFGFSLGLALGNSFGLN